MRCVLLDGSSAAESARWLFGFTPSMRGRSFVFPQIRLQLYANPDLGDDCRLLICIIRRKSSTYSWTCQRRWTSRSRYRLCKHNRKISGALSERYVSTVKIYDERAQSVTRFYLLFVHLIFVVKFNLSFLIFTWQFGTKKSTKTYKNHIAEI